MKALNFSHLVLAIWRWLGAATLLTVTLDGQQRHRPPPSERGRPRPLLAANWAEPSGRGRPRSDGKGVGLLRAFAANRTVGLLFLFLACITTGSSRDLMSDTWVATDALGRSLPGRAECGSFKPGTFVGIFYFLWMERKPGTGLYDISKLLAADPNNPAYGPKHAFHWWGEPHLGYYTSDDEFVIRKHLQMLSDAGVDVLIFDVTNAFIYEQNYLAICRVMEQVRRTGRTTPQLAFIANSHSAQTVQKLYEKFYSKNLHSELWFRWKGKPLILAPPDGLPQEIANFFTIRHSWAWTKGHQWFGDGKDKWPWLDNHPQNFGWHEAPDQPEQISVCVAQHPTSNIGRSFHNGRQPPPGQRAAERGLGFAEQWKRALEVSPEFVYITGWNEWIAQRFIKEAGKAPGQMMGRKLEPGDTFFVDQYNQEYSRDIEPMKGGHGDNYYYQMIDGIRRFKGVRPTPRASGPRSIRIDTDFSQWQIVKPEFLDDLQDTTHRHHPGYGSLLKTPYVNQSGRNDFDVLKVAHDRDNLYFYARTREPITTPYSATIWMILLLDVDGNSRNGWGGYDFVANRVLRDPKTSVLEKNSGGFRWQAVANLRLAFDKNELHVAIPRSALGFTAGKEPIRLNFKWADHIPATGDLLDFIDQGDAAPNARFNYRYEE